MAAASPPRPLLAAPVPEARCCGGRASRDPSGLSAGSGGECAGEAGAAAAAAKRRALPSPTSPVGSRVGCALQIQGTGR
jgi:hypothetical protein